MPPSAAWMRSHPAAAAEATDLVRSGAIPMDTFLHCQPRPSASLMEQLAACGRASRRHLHRAGSLDAVTLKKIVEDGLWTAEEAVATGPVPADLVRSWVASSRIDVATWGRLSLQVWQPEDLLPAPLRDMAVATWGVSLLLRDLPLPAESSRRASFARRMLATRWLVRENAAPQVPQAITTSLKQVDRRCDVCLEVNCQTATLVCGTACSHAGSTCKECLLQIATSADPRCPHEDCRKPLHPDDVLHCGGLPEAADALANTILHRLRASSEWGSCPTPGCCGGALIAVNRGQTITCRVCDASHCVESRPFDLRRDRQKILMLLDGLRARADADQAPVRPCYHCGFDTQHHHGCSHMTCPTCGGHWDFSAGKHPKISPGTAGDAMTYVPFSGLLLRAGIFAGVTAGQTGIADLHALATKNAENMGVFRSELSLALAPRRR